MLVINIIDTCLSVIYTYPRRKQGNFSVINMDKQCSTFWEEEKNIITYISEAKINHHSICLELISKL